VKTFLATGGYERDTHEVLPAKETSSYQTISHKNDCIVPQGPHKVLDMGTISIFRINRMVYIMPFTGHSLSSHCPRRLAGAARWGTSLTKISPNASNVTRVWLSIPVASCSTTVNSGAPRRRRRNALRLCSKQIPNLQVANPSQPKKHAIHAERSELVSDHRQIPWLVDPKF